MAVPSLGAEFCNLSQRAVILAVPDERGRTERAIY